MRSSLDIAFVTIGYSPRRDIVPELVDEIRAARPNAKLKITEYGALDGMAGGQLVSFLAVGDEPAFVTKNADGHEILVSIDKVEARLGELLQRIDRKGHDAIVLLCTGTVLPPMENTLVLEAQKIVDHAIEALTLSGRELGIVLPFDHQIDDFQARHSFSAPVRFATCSPYGSDEPAMLAGELEACGVTVMHCMGYDRAMRDALRARVSGPVLHARGLVAGYVGQLL